jgi:dCTP deaminase
MSIFNDADIRHYFHAPVFGKGVIKPFNNDQVQPSSYDVRLGNEFRFYDPHALGEINPLLDQSSATRMLRLGEGEVFKLHPGKFVLGSTVEWFEIPDWLVARLDGKSSLGRVGLVVHSTAGFVDPGFRGNLTLELANISELPIVLTPGMLIGQVSFMKMTAAAVKPYDGKYQDQHGPEASRYHENENRSYVAEQKRHNDFPDWGD